MRLSAFAVIAACAVLVPVSAAPAPIRLLVISSSIEEDSPLDRIRFGHAVPPMASYRKYNGNREILNMYTPPPALPAPGKGIPISPGGISVPPKRFNRPGCHGKKARVAILLHKIKMKTIKIGNCLRKVLGWPLIEVKHHHHHHHGQPPHGPNDEEAGGIRVEGGFVSIVTAANIGDEHLRHKHFYKHHGSFLSRLHHSLMALGRWEGRAVAFVFGCGLGVLIRMFCVLAIVSYRACRAHRDDGYATVGIMEEYDSDDETIISIEPPKYIYPVDEKLTVED
jgi:hypothetical protein